MTKNRAGIEFHAKAPRREAERNEDGRDGNWVAAQAPASNFPSFLLHPSRLCVFPPLREKASSLTSPTCFGLVLSWPRPASSWPWSLPRRAGRGSRSQGSAAAGIGGGGGDAALQRPAPAGPCLRRFRRPRRDPRPVLRRQAAGHPDDELLELPAALQFAAPRPARAPERDALGPGSPVPDRHRDHRSQRIARAGGPRQTRIPAVLCPRRGRPRLALPHRAR